MIMYGRHSICDVLFCEVQYCKVLNSYSIDERRRIKHGEN